MLVTAFAIICVHTSTAWPWAHVVHEDGRRTLAATILYFEHATRELPLDILLGIAIGGSVLIAFPPDDRRTSSKPRLLALALLTAATLTVILVGTAAKGGIDLVLNELLQNRTRFGVPFEFGSHWRYHLLERIAMMLGSLSLAGLLSIFFNKRHAGTERLGAAIVAGSICIYIVLTIVFSPGWLAFMQPFGDPRYLGHQAREVLTHGLVTVPMAWGLCMLMISRSRTEAPAISTSRTARLSSTIVATMIAGVATILLVTYVFVAAWVAGASSHGQTTDPVTLIFPHFFEHTFTYLVVSLFAALVYAVSTWCAHSYCRLRPLNL
jgi:hypothetical protein